MFIKNKYYNWYNNIIESAKSRQNDCYTEKHHIIPKSLGGNNDASNLVALTGREHYICHLLLTKITEGKYRSKMFFALHRMTNKGNAPIKTSRLYEYLRINHAMAVSKQFKGKTIMELYGKTHMHDISNFQKEQIRQSNRDRVWTEESKAKLSESQKKRFRENPESHKTYTRTTKHKADTAKRNRQNAKSFNFHHNVHGSVCGPIWHLHESFPEQKLRKDELWKLTAGKYKTYKGWSC